ncbi:MAG: hypothetical protein H0X66_18725 [Verrucomicrobia bacterium]|nr:hypothetical protein [Verrucomicrobiota bacterium]
MTTPNPQTDVPAESTTSAVQENGSINHSQLLTFCAAGLLICFFLPWINFFGLNLSGFDFAKQGGKGLLLWSIPIFCAITIFATLTKRNAKITGQLTGALPFFVLAYGLFQEGKDLMQVLGMGAWIGLVLGLALFILPRRLK